MASVEHPAPSGQTPAQTNSLHLDPSAFVEDLYNAVSVRRRQLIARNACRRSKH